MSPTEKEFILELEKLTRKYGLYIYGCGCCNSPALMAVKASDLLDTDAGYSYEDLLMWVAKSDAYDWREYSDKIVRE